MNADLKVLAGAGPEWSQRVKRLAANAPGLDIFTEGYVIRDAAGWSITDAGRTALQRMDRPAATAAIPPAPAQLEAPPARPEIAIVARCEPTPIARAPTKVANITDRRRLPRRAL